MKRHEHKHPKAIECLDKNKEAMLAFYDYPVPHWQYIRTSDPIESVVAKLRLAEDELR